MSTPAHAAMAEASLLPTREKKSVFVSYGHGMYARFCRMFAELMQARGEEGGAPRACVRNHVRPQATKCGSTS
jgi:hypothetical protein